MAKNMKPNSEHKAKRQEVATWAQRRAKHQRELLLKQIFEAFAGEPPIERSAEERGYLPGTLHYANGQVIAFCSRHA